MQLLRKAQEGANTHDTAYMGVGQSCGSQTAS